MSSLAHQCVSELKFFSSSKRYLKSFESKEKEASGFLSIEEAKAFWKELSPSPFPSKLRSSGKSLQNILDSAGPLKKDVTDMVLTTIFSDVFSSTHQSMFGPNAHNVFRTRSTQPAPNADASKDNAPAPKTITPPKQPQGTKAILAFLVGKGVLPKSDHPVFTEMFPSTDLPHLTFVNGLPKCNRSVFNSLLVSRRRACKTALKYKSTDRLSHDIVRHVSRLIDSAMVNAFNDKKKKKEKKTKTSPPNPAKNTKPAQEPSPVQTPPKALKAKKEKKSKTAKKSVQFVSASTPEQSSVPPMFEPLPTIVEKEVPILAATIPAFLDQFFWSGPNGFQHLTLSERSDLIRHYNYVQGLVLARRIDVSNKSRVMESISKLLSISPILNFIMRPSNAPHDPTICFIAKGEFDLSSYPQAELDSLSLFKFCISLEYDTMHEPPSARDLFDEITQKITSVQLRPPPYPELQQLDIDLGR